MGGVASHHPFFFLNGSIGLRGASDNPESKLVPRVLHRNTICVSVPSMNRLTPKVLLFGVLLLPRAGWAQPNPPDSKRAAEFIADSAAGLTTLQTWYVQETGLWKTTGWWNAANALTVLVDYSKLSEQSGRDFGRPERAGKTIRR